MFAELVMLALPPLVMVMPLLILPPESPRFRRPMALNVIDCRLLLVLLTSIWFMVDAENGPLKFVPDRMLTVSVLRPVVLNEDGLPLQVTVCPEDGGLGVHCATAEPGSRRKPAHRRAAATVAVRRRVDPLPFPTIVPLSPRTPASPRAVYASAFGYSKHRLVRYSVLHDWRGEERGAARAKPVHTPRWHLRHLGLVKVLPWSRSKLQLGCHPANVG